MNTGLFDYEVLLAATILLASAIYCLNTVSLLTYLKNGGGKCWRRRRKRLNPVKDFFYEHGQLRYDVCDKNHADIKVIYTLLNKRVEYKNVSKL